MSEKHYDYFVIGGGSAGVRSARIAAGHGAKVGLAESAALGGTCVNIGCVPKKLMAYGADFGLQLQDARDYGWAMEEKGFNWKSFIEKKNTEINRLNSIYSSLLTTPGVDIYNGHASFVNKNTLKIGDEEISADNILIATGASPRKPDFPGSQFALISDDMFYLEEKPQEIVIIGGGYIAVEFAHIFSGLGAHVHLIYRGEMFLKDFDRSLSNALAQEMQKQDHIDLYFHSDISSIENSGANNQGHKIYTVTTSQGKKIECDTILAAIGRIPNTQGLELDNAEITVNDDGTIKTNKDYQTSTPHIYALGDVTQTPNLTPVALNEGHVLADRLFNNAPERAVNYNYIATAIFSHPPISTVGISEEQALKENKDIKVFQSHFTPLKYSISSNTEKTLMKMIVDAKTDKVLGIHMIGLDAPEIMQGFAVALNAGATKKDFDQTIGIHPTSAEEFVTMRSPRQ